jgi:hypothetical protein
VIQRRTSLAFDLFAFWQTVGPGIGVTMTQMMEATNAADAQAVRQALTQLRKGEVPDPSERGRHLRPLPVRYNSGDGMYYDFSNVSSETVAATIPGAILANRFGELFTRVFTLESSIGPDGLVRSAQNLLDHEDIRRLIAQMPLPRIWQVQDMVDQIARARQLLEIEGRAADALPTGQPEEETE